MIEIPVIFSPRNTVVSIDKDVVGVFEEVKIDCGGSVGGGVVKWSVLLYNDIDMMNEDIKEQYRFEQGLWRSDREQSKIWSIEWDSLYVVCVAYDEQGSMEIVWEEIDVNMSSDMKETRQKQYDVW